MWKWIKRLASPKFFYIIITKAIAWFFYIFLLLFLVGIYWALVVAPIDYQQHEYYRIIFVHVPSAWMSLFIYLFMAIACSIGFIWQIKIANIIARVSAPIGAAFTFLALVTGSIWGKPSWGTWWEWDARLTSELILLFLYIAYISLYNSFDNHKTATKASSILAIVGLINLPIIHYSVNWWNTLHQPASISFTNTSIKDSDMLIALILMSFAFKFLYFVLVLMKAKYEILLTEQNSSWVKNIIIQLKT